MVNSQCSYDTILTVYSKERIRDNLDEDQRAMKTQTLST